MKTRNEGGDAVWRVGCVCLCGLGKGWLSPGSFQFFPCCGAGRGPCSRSVVACLALGDNVLSMKFASSPTMLPATIVDCHHHYLAPSEPFHAYINALGAPG
jgi:hypothetical protein